MAAKSNEESGANILPIPPALEFPFPHKGNERPSAYSACSNTDAGSSGGPMTSVTEGASSEPSSAIAANLRTTATTTPNPRPSLPKGKFLTERPVLAQRGTRLGLGRRQTTTGRTALTDAAWRSDSVSDFSSSSEDENAQELKKTRSNVSGQARKEKGSHVMKTDKDGRRGRSIGAQFSQFSVGNDDFKTKGKVSKTSGRLDISVNETSNRGYLAKALGTSLQHHLNLKHRHEDAGHPSTSPSPLHEEDSTTRPSLGARLSTLGVAKRVDEKSIPKLNLVIMVIGSRGDIQPFLKLGKILKEQHGHRVRIATHPAFRDFVEKDIGLEFFSVGGDPAELMAFMVKNPGLMPSAATIRAGEIGKKRESMFEMFQGFWRACINATDDESDLSNLKMMGDKHPFVADAIIANPPSFAHIHCAERLGIPLHLMFTFPYSPTQQFPHPLANIKQSNVDTNYANFISYPLVEMMYVTRSE